VHVGGDAQRRFVSEKLTEELDDFGLQPIELGEGFVDLSP
jgi:hypothetical protein